MLVSKLAIECFLGAGTISYLIAGPQYEEEECQPNILSTALGHLRTILSIISTHFKNPSSSSIIGGRRQVMSLSAMFAGSLSLVSLHNRVMLDLIRQW